MTSLNLLGISFIILVVHLGFLQGNSGEKSLDAVLSLFCLFSVYNDFLAVVKDDNHRLALFLCLRFE